MALMNPEQVRVLLGISNHTLKYWRDTSRLPGGESNPLYLPIVPDENPNVVWYDMDTVTEFIARNEKYRNAVLAKLAPKQAIEDFQPGPGLFGSQPHPAPATTHTESEGGEL